VYLKYVISLDKLLVARVKRLEANTSKVTKELHDMLHAIQGTLDNHIIYIFDRAVRRFSSEVVLWNDYIAFLQRKEAVTALNGVFGKALSLYPKNEDFWLQASIHELEANSNVHSARVTLQRALRAIPASSKLWLRYFELELWNALRSTERQKALEIVEDYEALQGAPLVVFNHALNAVHDVESVLEIYSACETVGGDFTLKMQEILISKHGHRKEVWQYLAMSALSAVTSVTKPDAAGSEDTSSKRKASDIDETTQATSVVTALAEGLEKVVSVLNQGAAHKSSVSSIDSATSSSDCSAGVSEYATMAVTTLHQSLLQAQQLLSEVNISSLEGSANNGTTAGSASSKKKPRKSEKVESAGSNGVVEKLGDALRSVLSTAESFGQSVQNTTAVDNKTKAALEPAAVSVVRAVQFEVYVLATTLSLSLATDSAVLNVHQLAAWVQSTMPVLSKYVSKHYQYQLSSAAASADCIRAVEGVLVPLASLLAHLAQHDDLISDTKVSECVQVLLAHASALIITPSGSELVKQAVQIASREASTTALQTLVTSTHALISPTARADWCEYYVEYALSGAASGSNESRVLSLSAAYKWVDTVIASKPHLFQSAALASYYEYVLDTAQSLLPAVGESSVGSVSSFGVSVEDTLRRFIESAA